MATDKLSVVSNEVRELEFEYGYKYWLYYILAMRTWAPLQSLVASFPPLGGQKRNNNYLIESHAYQVNQFK